MKYIATALFIITNLTIAAAAEGIFPLKGTEWANDKANNRIIIIFDSTDKIDAFMGCVHITGTYIQIEKQLTMSEITLLPQLTRNFCFNRQVVYERLSSLLSNTRSAEIKSKKLILRGEKKELLLKLQRQNTK